MFGITVVAAHFVLTKMPRFHWYWERGLTIVRLRPRADATAPPAPEGA